MAFKRWHISKSGDVVPCTAEKRECPRKHFDTQYEVDNYLNVKPVYDIPDTTARFESAMQIRSKGIIDVIEDKDVLNMRKLRRKSEEVFAKTGERLKYPEGKIDIDFGGENRLLVKRLSFYNRNGGISHKWNAIYFTDKNNYEEFEYELWNKNLGQYREFVNFINSAFVDARNKRVLKHQAEASGKHFDESKLDGYDKNLNKAFQQTIQSIAEVEIMAKGPEDAYTNHFDLFNSKDTPGVLSLSLDLNKSPIQLRDIVESLKVHSGVDTEVKKIDLEFKEKLPYKDHNWTLVRIPEGDWFMSFDLGNKTLTYPVIGPEIEIGVAIKQAYASAGANDYEANNVANYIKDALRVIDPAIKAYETAVEARLANPVVETPSATTQTAPVKPKSKLFGLFR